MSDLEDDVEAGWDEEASPSQPQAVAPSQGARRLKRKSRAPAEQGGDAELEDVAAAASVAVAAASDEGEGVVAVVWSGRTVAEQADLAE